jgi:hypothetical protein
MAIQNAEVPRLLCLCSVNLRMLFLDIAYFARNVTRGLNVKIWPFFFWAEFYIYEPLLSNLGSMEPHRKSNFHFSYPNGSQRYVHPIGFTL